MNSQAYVALVTCFNKDETIDYDATRAQARRQMEAGNNIMVCGTNGDFSALLAEEKIQLCEEIAEEVAGRVKVIANVGCPSTFETLKLAREVDGLGLHGIAVITPYFIACTQEGLLRHFATVADAISTGVYLYDIPARTQNHIAPGTLRKLAAHPNIVGLKDSGGSKESVLEYLEAIHDVEGFEVYSAPDHLVLWGLQQGCSGVVSGLGNVAPATLSRIVRAFDAGNFDEAEIAQETFAALRADLYALGFPPAMVKRALFQNNPAVGVSRQPALLPDSEQDRQIRLILEKHGLSS